jgi:Na+/H+-translocating membrane pyrophosphatase
MELKFEFAIKTEPFMQTCVLIVAILSLAGIVVALDSSDPIVNAGALAAITTLAFLLRLL